MSPPRATGRVALPEVIPPSGSKPEGDPEVRPYPPPWGRRASHISGLERGCRLAGVSRREPRPLFHVGEAAGVVVDLEAQAALGFACGSARHGGCLLGGPVVQPRLM